MGCGLPFSEVRIRVAIFLPKRDLLRVRRQVNFPFLRRLFMSAVVRIRWGAISQVVSDVEEIKTYVEEKGPAALIVGGRCV